MAMPLDRLEGEMGRKRLPAPGHAAVKAALDAARLRLGEIAEWLRQASPGGQPVAASTLKNYRDGRREMPRTMRRLLARQLRKHARRLETAAAALEQVQLR